ncbi:hypothetical protein IEQ34_021732 [Dendrobium chrysotoxum]|uniref:V-type proton ATPase proteolipid subunit n=1 Tax=Dendrobium chrysotoxum TaxID=161865 RepID=A0AAV7G5K9_DENCH|nr:hypothetical protein IEQ34_021732 [Dendrobium chrysotoxum]
MALRSFSTPAAIGTVVRPLHPKTTASLSLLATRTDSSASPLVSSWYQSTALWIPFPLSLKASREEDFLKESMLACFFAFVVPVGAAASSFSLFLSTRNSHQEFAANVTIFFSPSLFLLAWKSRREFAVQVPFFGFLDAAVAFVFSCMGDAYGTTKSGVGAASMDVMRVELVMKSIVSMVMVGVLGIYGLIISVIISTRINPKAKSYYLFNGYTHLISGMACGLVGLSAGMAIDIVGDAGVRANAQQPMLFVGMILILIFAKALALYGLIVGIILSSRAGQSRAD